VTDKTEMLRIEEYRSLRDTIRQRGSLRLIVITLTFSAWAAAILTAVAVSPLPLTGLVPLVVLSAGFEVVFALHVGVERIGRYLQVHHEPGGDGALWEQTAMRFRAPSGGVHALLPVLFLAAGLLNLAIGALLQLDVPESNSVQWAAEWLPSVILHVAFYTRVLVATRFAAGQRARDLKEFERLVPEHRSGTPTDPNV
jgi:hypothetical protein